MQALELEQDRDGDNNLNEFIAGLDPLDATSFFRIESVSGEGPQIGMFTVQWQTQPGRTYHLHFSETLTGGLGPVLFTVEGDGTMKSREVPRNGRKMMFCRISVQLSER